MGPRSSEATLKIFCILALFASLLIPSIAGAQSWSGIIPANHGGIDWTAVGIPGGIPSRNTICATLNASTFNNGATDATSAINSAISTCPSGQVVKLSAGTFKILGHVNLLSNVTLRGSGPKVTILNLLGTSVFGTGINIGSFGDTPVFSSAVNITSGANIAGATSFTVSSTSGMAVGRYLVISELNATTLSGVNYVANQSTDNPVCTWCDNGQTPNATRVRGQIVEITAISGLTVSFTPGLYTSYTLTPTAVPYAAAVKMAGVEDLQVFGNNLTDSYQSNFGIEMCSYCWISNVMSNYAYGDHIDMMFSYRSEVRDSYFTNAFSHTSGTTDADIAIGGKSSSNLIENNILERLHSSVILEWGAAGNVVGYNYSYGAFDSSSGAQTVVTIDFDAHGAHPQFNLLEGNITPHIFFDSFWGTGSFNTFFRNWNVSSTKIANPLSGRGVIQWSTAATANQQNRGISLSYTQTRDNIIGDAAGSVLATAAVGGSANLFKDGPVECISCRIAPGTRNYDGTFYAWDIGYDNGSESTGSGLPAGWVGLAYQTSFLHGIVDTADPLVKWDIHGTGSHTLPASFYKASKPTWWGNLPWPGIGPEVVGGIDVGGHVYNNAAGICYQGPKDSNGLLIFDAHDCYYSSTSTPPAAPTNLNVTVN
jgi:hypothetical protein